MLLDSNKNVEQILTERGKDYGDYDGGIKLRGDILQLITKRYEDVHNISMPFSMFNHFIDPVSKLSRLAVSPNHKDSWKDLAGYATLIERLEDEVK